MVIQATKVEMASTFENICRVTDSMTSIFENVGGLGKDYTEKNLHVVENFFHEKSW